VTVVRWGVVLAGALGGSVPSLAAPHPRAALKGACDSVVYHLAPTSRFEVKTGKAGLFGFAGHEHRVRARSSSGRVVYCPDNPRDSRVEIAVAAESLEVLTPPDTAEIRKVTVTMRTEILRVDRYPIIRFASTSVTPTSDGLHVEGQFTLVGTTRDVATELHLEIAADTLRATGSFSVKQTDFGIKPYRGGPGGTVRVADRVTIELAAVGLRAPDP
jgi:polyisoprenoid-binding protein YceI